MFNASDVIFRSARVMSKTIALMLNTFVYDTDLIYSYYVLNLN